MLQAHKLLLVPQLPRIHHSLPCHQSTAFIHGQQDLKKKKKSYLGEKSGKLASLPLINLIWNDQGYYWGSWLTMTSCYSSMLKCNLITHSLCDLGQITVPYSLSFPYVK